MQVDSVRVTFMRKRQPKDYENAMVEIGLDATLDDGEDHVEAMRTLLDDASSQVYERLGMKQGTGTDTTNAGGAAKTGQANKSGSGGSGSAKTSAQVGDTPPETPAESGSGSGQAAPASDLPDDMPPAASGSGSGQAAPASDLPDDTGPSSGSSDGGDVQPSMTPGEVQSEITKLVNEKRVTVKAIKSVLAQFGVERVNEVSKDQLPSLLAQIRGQASA